MIDWMNGGYRTIGLSWSCGTEDVIFMIQIHDTTTMRWIELRTNGLRLNWMKEKKRGEGGWREDWGKEGLPGWKCTIFFHWQQTIEYRNRQLLLPTEIEWIAQQNICRCDNCLQRSTTKVERKIIRGEDTNIIKVNSVVALSSIEREEYFSSFDSSLGYNTLRYHISSLKFNWLVSLIPSLHSRIPWVYSLHFSVSHVIKCISSRQSTWFSGFWTDFYWTINNILLHPLSLFLSFRFDLIDFD